MGSVECASVNSFERLTYVTVLCMCTVVSVTVCCYVPTSTERTQKPFRERVTGSTRRHGVDPRLFPNKPQQTKNPNQFYIPSLGYVQVSPTFHDYLNFTFEGNIL